MTRPPVASMPLSKPRLLTLVIAISLNLLCCVISGSPRGGPNRRMNPLIAPAPTKLAGHAAVDFGVAGGGLFRQKRGCLHDLAGLAVTTLRNRQVAPCDLHRVIALRIKSFDCRH